MDHGALVSAGGLTIIHPGVDVLQVATVDFVQGDLHGCLHVENVVVQGVGEENGQCEGVHLVHQDPHAPPKMDHRIAKWATLRDTRWDPGAGRRGDIAAEAVAPGRRAQVRRKQDGETTWAYEGDGPTTGRWSNLDLLPESWGDPLWQGRGITPAPSSRCYLGLYNMTSLVLLVIWISTLSSKDFHTNFLLISSVFSTALGSSPVGRRRF